MQFAYQVALQHNCNKNVLDLEIDPFKQFSKSDIGKWKWATCGGSIISTRTILSAAHCVTEFAFWKPGKKTTYDLTKKKFCKWRILAGTKNIKDLEPTTQVSLCHF